MKKNMFGFSIKTFISLGLVLAMAGSVTAAADGTVFDRLVGNGRLTYDSNGDGIDDVRYDQNDLVNIGYKIQENDTKMSVIQQRMTEVARKEGEDSAKVLAAYNSLVFEDLPAGSGYSDIAGALEALQSPSKFILSYAAGNNSFTSLTPTTNNPADVAVILKDKGYTVSLGIDQKITLPAGYYAKPITIKNGIQNNGGNNITLTDSQNHVDPPAGYYNAFTVTNNVSQKVEYKFKLYHHVHSNSTATATVVNTDFSTNIEGCRDQQNFTTLADNSFSNKKGGCYTVAHYHAHSNWTMDATSSTPGAYPETSTRYGGCYTVPVYHVHTAACYRPKIEYLASGNLDNRYQTKSQSHCADNALSNLKNRGGAPSSRTSLIPTGHLTHAAVPYDPSTVSGSSSSIDSTNANGHYDRTENFYSNYSRGSLPDNGWWCTFMFFHLRHVNKTAFKNFKDRNGYYGYGNEYVSGYKADKSSTYDNADRWADAGTHWIKVTYQENDSYKICGKTPQTIEYYKLGCNKTPSTVYYGLGCGRLRGEVVAGEVTQ